MIQKMLSVCYYTIRESMYRKTFVAFFILSTITLAFFLFVINFDVVDGVLAGFSLFGNTVKSGKTDLFEMIAQIETIVASTLIGGGIFLSIIATASIVPNMLQKGHIDWLISKPVPRSWLLLGRFLGAVSIVAVNMLYVILGTFLILSTKTGVWNFNFLFAGLIIIGLFAIIYAFMTIISVTIPNSAISIFAGYIIIFISPFLLERAKIYALASEKLLKYLLEFLYMITPRIAEISILIPKMIKGVPIDDFTPIWYSLLLGAFYFSSAVFIFQRKDF